MAALSDKLADAYQNARPRYPIDWFTKLAARTGQHKSAWDVGTGNGQAAIGVSFFHLVPKVSTFLCTLLHLDLSNDVVLIPLEEHNYGFISFS